MNLRCLGGCAVARTGLLLYLIGGLAAGGASFAAPPPMEHPAGASLGAAEIGIVANAADPLSLAIADYYRWRRNVPLRNIVEVNLPRDLDTLPAVEFERVKAQVDRLLPRAVQAIALTWTRPYRVECMSITSAFAFGFDRRSCADGCNTTVMSPYYDADSRAPHDDLRVRPTMIIAARDLRQAKALIERGIRADGTAPPGTAYLLDTSDRARSARGREFAVARGVALGQLRVEIVHADYIENRNDVLLYETGVMQVQKLGTNRFLPGAIADHLTSFGGQLYGTSQMSALRWLEVGATASFGTVVEPCAFAEKFPNPAVILKHYLRGETLIEAYWKSVAMPGQGLFVGEPLARPYAR